MLHACPPTIGSRTRWLPYDCVSLFILVENIRVNVYHGTMWCCVKLPFKDYKNPVLRARTTHIFHIGRFFSFFPSLLKSSNLNIKKKKNNVPTDRPHLEGPSARKTGFCLFVCLFFVCFLFVCFFLFCFCFVFCFLFSFFVFVFFFVLFCSFFRGLRLLCDTTLIGWYYDDIIRKKELLKSFVFF